MHGREHKKTMKRKNRMTLQCLAGTVRKQLMLRNLAILFMFFQHKQVLGSSGWEGHADKKKKEEPLFFLVCVIYSDESFLPTDSLPGISTDAQVSLCGSLINTQHTSDV